jgi:hypothetical protein
VVDSICVKALRGTAAPFAPETSGIVDEAEVELEEGPVVPAVAPEDPEDAVVAEVDDEPDELAGAVAERT